MSIKYYHLAKDEELPEEFCAIRDEGGEPNGYVFYVPESEVAKLREQTERLVTLLRNDCDIDASWDGLRRFWSIGLTENGCLMRDRACKAEAENAKLRELVDGLRYCANESHGHGRCSVRFVDGYVTYCPLYDVDSDTARCEALLRELGIEVDE